MGLLYVILGASVEARTAFGPACAERGLYPVYVGLDADADMRVDLYDREDASIRRPRGSVGGILGFVDQRAWPVAQWLIPHGVPSSHHRGDKAAQCSSLSARRVSEKGAISVVRPRIGCGSRGVLCRVPYPGEDQEGEIWTEYLDGPQVSVETVLLGGAVEVIAIGDRYYEIPPQGSYRPLELGGNTPSSLPAEVQAEIGAICRAHVRQVYPDLQNWTCKLDVIVTPHGPRVLESHLRLGGGWFASRQIPYALGIDLVGVAVDLSLGRYVDRVRLQARGTVRPIAWRLNADGTRSWGFGFTVADAVADAVSGWQRGGAWMEVES